MSDTSTPQHYRPLQIILHWVVVFGVIIQIVIHESIVRVKEALATGAIPVDTDTTLAWVHVGVGTTILLAVLARLYMRLRYGVPGHAPGTPALQARIASIMHRTLYALLLGMVLTGMLTWNDIAPLGNVHFVLNVVLFLLVLGHVGAALYNQFTRKDGTLRRMLPSRSS